MGTEIQTFTREIDKQSGTSEITASMVEESPISSLITQFYFPATLMTAPVVSAIAFGTASAIVTIAVSGVLYLASLPIRRFLRFKSIVKNFSSQSVMNVPEKDLRFFEHSLTEISPTRIMSVPALFALMPFGHVYSRQTLEDGTTLNVEMTRKKVIISYWNEKTQGVQDFADFDETFIKALEISGISFEDLSKTIIDQKTRSERNDYMGSPHRKYKVKRDCTVVSKSFY